jgi:hypothetical protein
LERRKFGRDDSQSVRRIGRAGIGTMRCPFKTHQRC